MPTLLDTLWQLQLQPDSDPAPLFNHAAPSADEGQALQFQLLDRWLNEGEELGGWKIGMTSGESRDALGVGVRPSGFVLKSRIFRSGTRLPRSALYNGGVLLLVRNWVTVPHREAPNQRWLALLPGLK